MQSLCYSYHKVILEELLQVLSSHTSRAIQYIRQVSRYELMYLDCSFKPASPYMWSQHATRKSHGPRDSLSNGHIAILCQELEPAGNLALLRGVTASSPSSETAGLTLVALTIHLLIISACQNKEMSVVKPLERVQDTCCFGEGHRLTKRKENNRKATQQGWWRSKG